MVAIEIDLAQMQIKPNHTASFQCNILIAWQLPETKNQKQKFFCFEDIKISFELSDFDLGYKRTCVFTIW